MSEQAISDEIDADPAEFGGGRRLCDVVALAVLAGLTMRILAALAAGYIRIRTSDPNPLGDHQRLADIIRYFAGFGDGQGVLLAAAASGLVWWQVHTVPDSDSYGAEAHADLSLRLCAWMTAIWGLTAVASFAYFVGIALEYWQSQQRSLVLVGSGGFYLSYGILGFVGVYAVRQLSWIALLKATDDLPDDDLGEPSPPDPGD